MLGPILFSQFSSNKKKDTFFQRTGSNLQRVTLGWYEIALLPEFLILKIQNNHCETSFGAKGASQSSHVKLPYSIKGARLGSLICLHSFKWFDHVVWFVACSIMFPHLQVQTFQIHSILLGVEQRATHSLFPHLSTDLL